MKSEGRSIVTKEQYDLLKDSGGRRTALGYLEGVREGLTLERVHDESYNQPFQEEHRPRKQAVYDYLDSHRKEFDLPTRE